MENLWGEIPAITERTPTNILFEQLRVLEDKTKQVLTGKIDTIALPAGGFKRIFYLVAPALHSYSFELFWIRHGIELYPVTTEGYELLDEEHFTDWLRGQLSSPRTKRIIVGLLSHIDPLLLK